ncbi:MAG: hypothetical protein SV062_00600, partial [Thermodesulfobacteriota bacterium]|nr:hypothetical protein [Thermodesulfobacteriota bacterium]
EAFEPDVWDCMWMCLGDLNLDAFSKESSQRKLLQWPEKMYMGWSYMGVSDVDKSDQCMAPPEIGFKLHTEQFTLPAWAMTDKEWKKNEKEWAENAIEKLQQYTTNVNWDIVAGYTPVTPYYTARMARNYAPAGNWAVIDNTPAQMGRFRPIAELAGYRVPELKGLYCTGTAWHPFALAWSTQGYNCYKVIAEDFGLTKTWEDRPF